MSTRAFPWGVAFFLFIGLGMNVLILENGRKTPDRYTVIKGTGQVDSMSPQSRIKGLEQEIEPAERRNFRPE